MEATKKSEKKTEKEKVVDGKSKSDKQETTNESNERTAPAIPLKKSRKKSVKTKVAEAWPGIMDKMVQKAEGGSINHAKFIVDMGRMKDDEPKKKRGGKSFTDVLREELKKKQSAASDESGSKKKSEAGTAKK